LLAVDKVIAKMIRHSGLLFLAHPVGSDRRPETKQGIAGKIDRFRPGRVRVGVRDRVRVKAMSD